MILDSVTKKVTPKKLLGTWFNFHDTFLCSQICTIMQNNIFEKKKQKTINYERREKPKIGFHNLHTPISIVISNKIRSKLF